MSIHQAQGGLRAARATVLFYERKLRYLSKPNKRNGDSMAKQLHAMKLLLRALRGMGAG